VLAKLWRVCFYRDSGPTLILDRIQQVEHEAYLTFMAGRAGVLVPEMLPAGRFGPGRDALKTSNTFTSLVGGDVAVFAVLVRFFQRQGYDAETAVSSGAIASTACWVAKGLLLLVSTARQR
jgi:hypothetical protein